MLPQLELEETSATSPAPGVATNLALAMAMVLTAATRQAGQQGTRCRTLSDHQRTATATSSSTADATPPAADACKRDGAARGAASGGDASASRLAAQGRCLSR
jgi:hypothetical protein